MTTTAIKDVQVNMLPMRSYRWLKMNSDSMNVVSLDGASSKGFFVQDKLGGDSAAERDPSIEGAVYIPDGVIYEADADKSVIHKIFSEEIAYIKEKDSSAVPPNGDELVKNVNQPIPTGMGREIDRIMEGENVPIQIYSVPDNTEVKEALEIAVHPSRSASLVRQVFHIGKNSSVTILVDSFSKHKDSAFCGIQTYVLAEENSKVTFVQVQMLPDNFEVFDDFGGIQKKNTEFNLIRVDLGASKLWSGVVQNQFDDDTVYNLSTAYLCRDTQRYDYNYVSTMRGKRALTKLHFNGVMDDKAYKTLRGTIDFRTGAVEADGEENEITLMMSPDVVNRTVPIILCQEEDISGHHGATIGQTPEEMLFYMQTRGFSKKDAERFLIRARIQAVSNLMPDCLLRKRIEDYLWETL